MERKVGENFTVRGTTLEVVENPECDGCFFYKAGSQYCSDYFDEAGYCSMRRDKKSVIFKAVKKQKSKKQENANADEAQGSSLTAQGSQPTAQSSQPTAQSSQPTAQSSSLTAHGSLPISIPVHMYEEEKQKALMALPHESIEAFSKLYANFICDCEEIGIRVTGVEFYPEKKKEL